MSPGPTPDDFPEVLRIKGAKDLLRCSDPVLLDGVRTGTVRGRGPCVRCGVCCADKPCGICRALFGESGTCPALEIDDAGASCGLVTHASRYVDLGSPPAVWRDAWFGEHVAGLLGIGKWCDGEPGDRNV